jgi:hypothetical protein
MRQICNLAYAILIENRTTAQIAELDVILSGPEDKEKMLERQNVVAMRELEAQMGGVGMLVKPPPGGPRRKPKDGPLRNSGKGDQPRR